MQLSRQERNKLFACANDINDICQPLFQKSPISYFDYHCFYHNGHHIPLSNQSLLNSLVVTESLYPTFAQHQTILQLASHWVFLSENMPLPPDNNNREKKTFTTLYNYATQLNIFHRAYFIRQFDDRFLISGFGINDQPLTLTQRQLDCLTHYDLGYSTKTSAEKSNISHRMVERHLNVARKKIGSNDKKTLRTVLQENGILF